MKPIRIYIVDDEIMSIHYMQRMLEDDPARFALAGSATSAARALEEIPRLAPDVVLADINMPVMDGLEMVARLKEKQVRSAIFLLTAYQDFDYAKRGLELGVSGYLLKHEVTPEQLYAECAAQMEALRLQRQRAHSHTERGMRRFLRSGGQEQPPPTDAIPGGRYYLMGIFVRRPYTTGERRPPEAVFDCLLLEDLPFAPPLACRHALQMDGESFLAVFSAGSAAGASRRELQAAAALLRGCMAQAGLETDVVISEGMGDVLPMPYVYTQLDRLGRLAGTAGGVTFLADAPAAPAAPADFSSGVLAVARMMHRGERENAAACLAATLDSALETATREEYEALARQAEQALRDFCRQTGLDARFPGAPERGFAGAQALRGWLLDAQQACFAAQDAQQNQGYSPKIVRALEYLRLHYAEDIAIQEVADAAGLSEGHLRKLFKAEVGTTLISCLTDLRIRRAMELMQAGGLRVVDIYKEVGFASSQYFSNVFKKKVGVSPNEYMKNA